MSNPESIAAYLEDQKTKGYSLKESDEVKQMIKESHANYLSEINNNSDPKDTHMKSNLSKIQLAFQYKGVPFLNPIGYAPGGAYLLKEANVLALCITSPGMMTHIIIF